MQVETPTPPAALDALSPSSKSLLTDHAGSFQVRASPLNPSPRRLRRSLRLSGAPCLTPQHALNKENLGDSPINQASTSAKTLDVGLFEDDKLSSSRLNSPFSSSAARNPSPLRSQSSPLRKTSPSRRDPILQSDDIASSSDESDDSTLVFFGKPSSAEKKKRMHYEQRVLEKRLKHKDSLDLARRRSINFNPDDTMLVDDQNTHGWSWSKPSPTPLRTRMMLLSSPALSPSAPESPTKSRSSSTRPSSPETLALHPNSSGDDGKKAHQNSQLISVSGAAADMEPPNEHQQELSSPKSQQTVVQLRGTSDIELLGQGQLGQKSCEKPAINPFIASQTTMPSGLQAKSPSKQPQNSPRRSQSPIRSVETLIGATMAHNRDFVSPMRSPRRSPRLSLQALQLSTSPTKSIDGGLFFGPTTLFQQSFAVAQKTTPLQLSTPFEQPTAAPAVPPSTGLSRFACLQSLAPLQAVPETPSTRVLSSKMTHQTILPSPFISSSAFSTSFNVGPSVADVHASPSCMPSRSMRTPSPAKPTRSPQKLVENITTPLMDESKVRRNLLPSKAVQAPDTPSVRFAEPKSTCEAPSKPDQIISVELHSACTPSPIKSQLFPEMSRSPRRTESQFAAQSSSARSPSMAEAGMAATPPRKVAEFKPETPCPVFRQTARRVPIHQHEADFGVKVSPEKPSYSPRRTYANSSARSNDFGVKPERVPARRVPIQPAVVSRQNTAKSGEASVPSGMRLASVASKTACVVSIGSGRIGSHNTSLPPAALSRAASATNASSISGQASNLAAKQSGSKPTSATQGHSVASKASRLQRPASAVFGSKQPSPTKQARSLSGLPRPKSASATAPLSSAVGPGSRLPRPATFVAPTTAARPTSRPVPMAIARLAPSQKPLQRSATGLTAAEASIAVANADDEAVSVPSSSELSASDADTKSDVIMAGVIEETMLEAATSAVATTIAADRAEVKDIEEGHATSLDPHAQTAASVSKTPAVESGVKPQPVASGPTLQYRPVRPITKTANVAPVRSSSPNMAAPPTRMPSSTRPAPPVMLDPEQQRLRCLAMQEKARNRAPKISSSVSAATSSDVEELPSSEVAPDESSPLASPEEHAQASATPSVGPGDDACVSAAFAASHFDGQDTGSATVAPSGIMGQSGLGNTMAGAATPAAAASTAGRPLRSARTVSRQLTPSATRVAPSRGRALSLNDIIAARKIDVPLSLTDQLRLADTVNKKHNEKILARYKVTKIQRPYERPPSPDRHDHEPEACTIIDDFSSHRQGKGDMSPYSTPVKSSTAAKTSPADGHKCVRWYRPLFVGKGARYGIRACDSKPALKPIQYELDRMGNKVPTGTSPKLSKGQSIVIYRNYFKGEPEPADD
ncbi:hypothetical protein NDA18_003895 [Ustilago nuda]|nr:hypothetical protein NDA18_003895 [Ustilago nuda]